MRVNITCIPPALLIIVGAAFRGVSGQALSQLLEVQWPNL